MTISLDRDRIRDIRARFAQSGTARRSDIEFLLSLIEDLAQQGDEDPARAEYEAQRRRLEADAEDARKTLNRARATYDDLCNQLRELRLEWQEQQRQEQP